MKLSTRRVLTVGAALGIMIGSVALAQASMASTTPTGPDSGDLSTSPSTFFVGDTITIKANFADSQSGKVITFYKETSPGSGQYDSIGTKTANSSGNGSLTGYTINTTQKVFARTSAGKETEIDRLAPRTVSGADGLISACVNRDDGGLSILFSTACKASQTLLTWNQQGEKGDKGDTGSSGTSQAYAAKDDGTVKPSSGDVDIVTKSVPAGKYVINVSAKAVNGYPRKAVFSCSLYAGTSGGPPPGFVDDVDVTALAASDDGVNGYVSMSLTETADLGTGGPLRVSCSKSEALQTDDDPSSVTVSITAIKVDSIG